MIQKLDYPMEMIVFEESVTHMRYSLGQKRKSKTIERKKLFLLH